jgi:fermentation-respiration switch protein FrsA (DUF1100 family)
MKPPSVLRRLTRTSVVTVVAGLGLLAAFQSRFIYFPQHYQKAETASFLENGGERLEFTTSQGEQTAWLRLPAGGSAPERVWIVAAGNGSMALDFAGLPELAGLRQDAFVFFDYPGYGICDGKPHPRTIQESLRAVGPLITERCQLPAGGLATRGIVFGHSLGAAVALMAAEEYGIRRAVLLAPFTSTMDLSRELFKVPLGWLVTHRFDNRAGLASLGQRGGHAWVFHGTDDEVIPLRMARLLTSEAGPTANFEEIPGGRHNNLLESGFRPIGAAMQAARKEG